METRNTMLAAAALLAVAGIQSTASATLLAYEPFSQTAGNGSGIEGSTTSDTFGFSGNWANASAPNTTSITTGSLTSPYALPSEDNEVQFNASATDEEQRTLSTSVQSSLAIGSSVFVSFLIQLPGETLGLSSSPTSIMKLFDGTGSTQVLAIGYNPSWSTSDWGVKIGTATPIATTVVATTTTTMLVAELDYKGAGSDSVEYYIGNSNTGALTEVYASPSNLTFTDPVGVIQLLAQANGTGNSQAIYDEIRVGQTLADVAAPEPASLGLLAAVGAAGMLRRRRRQV